jgi:uncharacterized membrane protein YozB (DUF420 family)
MGIKVYVAHSLCQRICSRYVAYVYVYIYITILSVIASHVYLSVCTYIYVSMLFMSVCLSVWFLILGSGSIILEFKSVCQTVESISASCDDCHWFIKRGKCVI